MSDDTLDTPAPSAPGATSRPSGVPPAPELVPPKYERTPPVVLPPTTTAEEDRQSAGERLALRTLAPATTEEQDRKTLGQREINMIWETTQMRIALSVIWVSLVAGLALSVFGSWLGQPDVQLAAVVFLFGVANLVTGFYFGRTNHQRQGGVGGDNKQEGR